MTTIAGKFLMRKASGTNGKKYLTVTGVCELPSDLEVDDGDEMWAVKFMELESIKFTNPQQHVFSPEDFLANDCGIQDPRNWRRKV